MKKILPFVPPKYTTYNYIAALDVCAQNDKRMDKWYISKYILWRYVLSEDCIHIVRSGVFGDVSFMYQQNIWKRHIKNYYKNIFKSFLDDGFYVYCTNIDEYYIPSTHSYNNLHFPHDVLIYGYDMEKSLYYISTYSETGHYSTKEISMECFDRAWWSQYNRSYDQEISEGCVKALKLEENKEFMVDLNQMLNDLKLYVNSECVDVGYKPAVYGIDVYKCIDDYVVKAIKREISFEDCRMLKLVSEHKSIMLKRFQFLHANNIISGEMVERYEEIYNKSENIRMLQLKYLLTNDLSILYRIKNKINEISEKELELLSRII